MKTFDPKITKGLWELDKKGSLSVMSSKKKPIIISGTTHSDEFGLNEKMENLKAASAIPGMLAVVKEARKVVNYLYTILPKSDYPYIDHLQGLIIELDEKYGSESVS